VEATEGFLWIRVKGLTRIFPHSVIDAWAMMDHLQSRDSRALVNLGQWPEMFRTILDYE
jgi:hypothetical protein